MLAEYGVNGGVPTLQKEYGYRNGQLLITAEAGTTATNVALASNGATVTASSTFVNPPYSYPVGAVINGDRKGLNAGNGGNWAGATFTFPQWVEITFNGSKTINEIDVFTLQDNYANPVEPTEATTFSLYGVTGFEAQYWNGGWVTVPGGSVTGSNKVWRKITFPSVTTTKIRVLTNASIDNLTRLVEVEAWSPPVAVTSTNVASTANGATATASSTFVNPPYSYPVSAVINGDRKGLNAGNGGNWAGATFTFPQWVEVTFNGSKTINEIDVFTLQDNYANPVEPTEATTFSLYGVTGFEAQYWNDSAWVTVPGGSVTGSNKVWRKITFAPITTTKIRVVTNASIDNLTRLVEVEAWSPASANINWLVSDHLGTPRMVIDQTGTLANVKRHDYLPFGEELFAPTGGRSPQLGYGSGDGVRQQFTSKERDVETGLDYFGARYYGSMQGRFTSPDEFSKDSDLWDPQSWNKYAYVRNNPLKYIDPNGEKATVEIVTDEKNKTGTITISASIAIWTSKEGGVSQDDLEKAKFFIEKDIEGAWSGTYVQDGITYTVKTDVSVEIKGDKRAALESGLQNAIEITAGPQGSHTDSYVRGRFSGPDVGKWNLGITGTSNTRGVFRGVASHEFTHILGVFDRFSGPDLSNTHVPWDKLPGHATSNDFRWALGGVINLHRDQSRQPNPVPTGIMNRAPYGNGRGAPRSHRSIKRLGFI